MKDHKALQGATSHYFGDKFSRAYNVTFTGRDNKLQYPFQTSWGSTTRMIGAVIMAHGDNNGLVLPPKIAPIQVIVLPVAMHKAGVLEKAAELKDRLVKAGLRVKLDDSDNSMGWKCAQYEMKGVPVRVEIGPRDIEAGQCVLVRRNDGEKTVVALENLEAAVAEQLELVQKGMFEKAKQNLDNHIYEAHSLEEAVALFPADEEVFVIGGAQIYAAALPLARKFYLTRVFRAYEGDTRFPAWDEREWRLVSSESFSGGKDYPWPFAFELYERR